MKIDLCRLCLQLIDESSVGLFEHKNGHLVADLVKVICPIDIQDNEENLPKDICHDCYDLVIDAVNLRDVSLINDTELRRKSEHFEESKQNKIDLLIYEEDERIDDEVLIEALDEAVLDDELITIRPNPVPLLIEHTKEIHSKPKKVTSLTNYCELCGNFFFNSSSFKRHQLRKHKKVIYSCDLCNSSFKTKRDIEQHLKKRHLSKKPEIKYISVEKLTSDLSEIYEKLDEPERLICSFCSYTDSDMESLNFHLLTHQAVVDSGKMYCIHCPTAITTMDFMIEHTRSHNDPVKTHRCLICNKTFPFDDRFQNHLKNHRKNQHKICFCPLCERKFSSDRVLEDHIRFIHNKEHLFSCSFKGCEKGFGSKSALNGHVKRHIEGNKFQCPFCPKTFSSHNLLISHKVVHSKERPFGCTLCEKTFKNQKVLNDHLKRHEATRELFVCSICNKSLMTPYALTRHLKLHSGDKPFCCEFCTKSYAQKNDLNKHVRLHVGQKTYFCEFKGCELTFRIQADLKFHQGSHYVFGAS